MVSPTASPNIPAEIGKVLYISALNALYWDLNLSKFGDSPILTSSSL